jgi:sugar/nucleoside kinase (ribokinase family)
VSRPQLYVIGSLGVEVIAHLADAPAASYVQHAQSLTILPSSVSALAACVAARLGGKVAFFGQTANDTWSDVTLKLFKRYAVDSHGVERLLPHTPLLFSTQVAEERRPRYSYAAPQKLMRLRDSVDTFAGQARVCLLDGSYLDAMRGDIERIKRKGFEVVCWLDSLELTTAITKNTLKQLAGALKQVDMLLVSRDLLAKLFPDMPWTEAGKRLAGTIPFVLCWHWGEPVHLFSGSRVRRFHAPSFARCKDITGNQAALLGAFIYHYSDSGFLDDALKQAGTLALSAQDWDRLELLQRL